jgi:pimeloyl-ACP methyl ester carboxylesterase
MMYTPLRKPRHEFVTVRGLKHRLTRWGPPGDAPIVLLHGYLDCGATWQFLVDCLPETWSLVAPDWRGFGESAWAPDGYWFPDYLADLEVLLETVVPHERARIIGHSMGANIAALYCGVRPQRARWFVNLEGVGLPPMEADAAPARYARWLDELREPLKDGRYRSVEQFASVLEMRNPRLTPERAAFVARAWTRNTGETELEGAKAGGEVQLSFDPRHRLVNPVLYRAEEARACWQRIEIPILLLTGGVSGHRERVASELNEAQTHSLFRKLQIETLPGLGHMMHHEDPQAVATPIIEFERAHR